MLSWILCALLLLIVLILMIKIKIMHKEIENICNDMDSKLKTDTNTLISVNTMDKYICNLASRLNTELRILRKEKIKLCNGNAELKNAVTSIAHDLRTPLTAICGYLDLINQEEKSLQLEKYLDIISGRIEVMKLLTEELFNYSVVSIKSDDFLLQEVNVGSVLEETIVVYYASFLEKNITPKICITEEKVIRKLNKEALSRVFSNLISNAIKYSDGDLEITLSKEGRVVFINSASELDNVQTEKLFDRFFTVQSAKKSTGLGLSIAKLLVERMNGKINAEYKNKKLYIYIDF